MKNFSNSNFTKSQSKPKMKIKEDLRTDEMSNFLKTQKKINIRASTSNFQRKFINKN